MDDYISRQWLLNEYDRRHKGPQGGARKMIEEAPSAQPKRKKGQWIIASKPQYFTLECDQCGYIHVYKEKPIWTPNYCPSCGAEMRINRKDED